MTEEEAKTKWCPVGGYEGLYEVSDAGQVRSLDRMKPYRNGERRVSGRTLRPGSVSGYPRVLLWKGGASEQVFVHRLVALAHIGPAPSPRHQINHLNGDRSDARAANLEWVTAGENLRHAFRELGRAVAFGVSLGPENGRYKHGGRSKAGQP